MCGQENHRYVKLGQYEDPEICMSSVNHSQDKHCAPSSASIEKYHLSKKFTRWIMVHKTLGTVGACDVKVNGNL